MSANSLRKQMHRLVDKLADEELELTWQAMLDLHCDHITFKAIQEAKSSQQPWDMLSHEEAVRLLAL